MTVRNDKGFTLIELIIVIIILGVLTALISGNFISSLKKGRDARRKSDLESIQKALEMYYEDKKAYPPTLSFGSILNDVALGKTYMFKVPNDPLNNYMYIYDSDGTYFELYSCIENTEDHSQGIKLPDGYTTKNCGSCGNCRYAISSPNRVIN